MAPRKKKNPDAAPRKTGELAEKVEGLRAETVEQPITETLETNYMPYAMSVIISRAIPEIDGFKPSHRKLLYTMYKMGLLNGARVKSANIVGQTMKLNPHGDAAIYDTMVRLSRGYGALLTPFVDSKGNFGKVYSRDMAYAAPRYTEAKLAPICSEIFRDIDKDTVEFTDNYDGTMKEPMLLPTQFPNILVSANLGIAVGMASQICGFNLNEVCTTAIELIRNPDHDVISTMPAPDFPWGAEILYSREDMERIYETGRGSFRVRARWRYIQKENIIEIYEIPYTTTSEAILDKTAELIKSGKIREINDMRDETDLQGLKIAIDLKRGTDPEKLMQKLFRLTPLQDSFSCNFNVLIAGNPKVMGVKEILEEWIAWRMECVRRRTYYEMTQKKEKFHLLSGLKTILLDIDKAIAIIRETEHESDVVPNLMIGFGIDEQQAEFIAEIKLRNINKEYILKRTKELADLKEQIADLEETVGSPRKIRRIIIGELQEINRKYPMPRKTGIVSESEVEQYEESDDLPPDYHVNLIVSHDGYLKKMNDTALRMTKEQKQKEGDSTLASFEGSNNAMELLLFTSLQRVYKVKVSEYADTKASSLGHYLPGLLEFEEDEKLLAAVDPGTYDRTLLLFFENGKTARFPSSVYRTKTNRRRQVSAFSDKSPLRTVLQFAEETDIAVFSDAGRCLIFNTSLLMEKTSRTTQGVSCMTLRRGAKVDCARPLEETRIVDRSRYRARNLPASGALLKPEDQGIEQLSLTDA